ncbi:hypothetical protein EGJ86_23530 [Pseudomonas sp. o96-267]|uniref:hypothetical protein n=1 Tax=Pseudomonas sp. o96-267 TaxID=2479853 RepID=UPI000F767267|nr:MULTISPECIES: hypothetical protein [Pseudomonas]MDH0961056.1 hypothetical protein [Pseudomonas chengduensis]MDV5863686.1 hypothetical protein [Pseudomonas mendocina]RRV28906.1 hypothetical protein EGJ86_23530 [Pseudomonas sp. o96-267]
MDVTGTYLSYQKSFSSAQYRVTLDLYKQTHLERSSHDSRGGVIWQSEANRIDNPECQAALAAYAAMGERLTAEAPESHFLNEQLAQWSATLAGRAVEDGAKPSEAVAAALTQVSKLVDMPLQQAVINLQREGLLPDTQTALQAQLMISASKASNDQALMPLAMESFSHDSFPGAVRDMDRESSMSTVEKLQLTDPGLITQLRTEFFTLLSEQPPESKTINSPYLHFPKGASVSAIHGWLDHASNHPLTAQPGDGAVRVFLDWKSNELMAEKSAGGRWEAMDTNAPETKAAMAAYRWSAEHAPESANSSPLHLEAFKQRAAHLAATDTVALHHMEAAQRGISEARSEATSTFLCSHNLAMPVGANEDTANFNVTRHSIHRLTKAGIANHVKMIEGNPNYRPDAMEALMVKDSLAIGAAVIAPEMRMEMRCEPKHFLRISAPSAALGGAPAAELRDNPSTMAQAAGLDRFEFRRAESLEVGRTIAHIPGIDAGVTLRNSSGHMAHSTGPKLG